MQAFPICPSQICLSLNGYIIAISLECFVVAIQLLLHLKIENFCFLDWLYFCFTCIQFSRCKLFWRFDPSKPNNEYLSQPCVEKYLRKTIRTTSLYSCVCSANLPKISRFFQIYEKTIRITAWYSCVCSANSLCNLLLPCLASDAFQHKSQTVFSPLFSIERRWSSRTFRYGYLVTTSPQLSVPPSAAPSLRLGHWLRALLTPMVWRAVCTRPGNVFTATFWFAITSDSSFM